MASDRVCATCPKQDHVELTALIEMEPGHDGQPWYLCRRCYFQGIKPPKVAPPEPSGPEKKPARPKKKPEGDRPLARGKP